MTIGRVLVVIALLIVPGRAAGQGGPLGADGAKAYQMARAAEDAVNAAQQEGATAYQAIQELPAPRNPEALKKLQTEATATHEALGGYRKRALESAGEALSLLAEVTRAAVTTAPPPPGVRAPAPAADPIRREVYEQKALLAAHEASVMAARARAEAERLRAFQAEAKALLAAAPPAAREAPARPEAVARPSDVVEVPNLVGARLDAAVRDLQAAGLRLGATVGPRDGFIVKQTPAGGARLPRQGAVSVTLSATAAGTTVITPK